ncbi:MAG: DUF975 family protein [Oscillospiraceae bacterium]|nr:DUF975 family protein [Oscillospiraceae bacterium]
MWDRREIKSRGKAAFKANYWACVIVALILTFSIGGGSSSGAANNTEEDAAPAKISVTLLGGAGLLGLAVQVLALNPLEAGCKRFFIENSRADGKKTGIDEVLYFFKEGRWGNAVKVMFVYKLVILLWSLLLIVPGIVKGYAYRLVPYLLNENPNIDAREALDLSSRMMKGNKSSAFVYDLSYIGWYLLGVFTLGILLIFHVQPWVLSSDAVLCRTIAGERDYSY